MRDSGEKGAGDSGVGKMPFATAETDMEEKDYKKIIGKEVTGRIDRPLGSCHPKYKDLIYPVNYGYVEGIFAGDGEEQDVYLLGTDVPVERFSGKVVAVYHRFGDKEDKWIVTLDGAKLTEEEILEAIWFQEKYFDGKLYR